MTPWVRTLKATVDPDEDRWRQACRRQRRRTLPAPAPAAVVTAITILEVRAGMRPARQLEPLCHHSLWPVLQTLPGLPSGDPIPVVPRPRAVVVREPIPGLVDAAVVIEFGGRPQALGLRLDGARGFWELVELDYATERTRYLSASDHGPPAPRAFDAGGPLPHRQTPARRREPSFDLSQRLRQGNLQRGRQPLDGLGIELDIDP